MSRAYVGVSCATKPTRASWAGSSLGRCPRTSMRARRRREEADREVQQRRLAGAVRADEADDVPGGMSRSQSLRAQRRP